MPAIHYIPRKISKIGKNDSKIAITGEVVESKDDSFILDDGTGKIEVFNQLEGTDSPKGVKVDKDDFVRAFCTMIGTQLKADVVQSLKGLDVEQLKKIEELYNKAGV
jgi:uncharacterized protein YdeI (BOF family)